MPDQASQESGLPADQSHPSAFSPLQPTGIIGGLVAALASVLMPAGNAGQATRQLMALGCTLGLALLSGYLIGGC